jgi:pimeloyl-ACP methyl ester carboxylesterase
MDLLSSRAALVYRRSGEGRRVVLVHGIPGAGRSWEGVVAALTGLEVIVPDLLGFGGSAAPAYSIEHIGPEAQSRALERLLDELGGQPVVLVGHDFGGPVSILLAGRRPDLVSAVFLLSANAFPDTPIPFPLSLTTLPIVGPVVGRAMFSSPSLALMLKQGVGDAVTPPDAAIY